MLYDQVPMPADAKALLRLGREANGLGSLHHPWYVKAHYQAFDENGKPSHEGELEQWWAAPGRTRVSYTGPAYSASLLQNGDAGYRSGAEVPQTEELVHEALLSLIPDGVEAGKLKKGERGERTVCVRQDDPFPAADEFCFDAEHPLVLSARTMRGYSYAVGRMMVAGHHFVPGEIRMYDGPRPVFACTVEELRGLRAEESEALGRVPEAAIAVQPGSLWAQTASAAIISKLRVAGDQPRYPGPARTLGEAGAVAVRLLIGQDGAVREVAPAGYSDPSLTDAVVRAARTWRYKPYLVDGRAVAVRTAVVVDFEVARHL